MTLITNHMNSTNSSDVSDKRDTSTVREFIPMKPSYHTDNATLGYMHGEIYCVLLGLP